MSKKLFFVFVLAVFLVMTSYAVSAAELASDISVKVDNTVISGKTIGVIAGKTIHVEVTFNAIVDEKVAKVKAWIDGYKDDIEAETDRFDVYKNGTYSSDSITPLYLEIPIDLDVKEDLKLVVSVAGKNDRSEKEYQLTVQRPSYELEILSVGFVREVESGDALQLDVVVKNRGGHKIEDIFVKAKIPELGLVKGVYANDLVPVDCDDCDFEDAVEKTVTLQIPESTKSGTYKLEITASNYDDDASTSLTDSVTIKGVEEKTGVEVLTTQLSKEITIGGKEIYTLEIFNPSDEAKTVTISTPAALEAQGIKITATPSVVTVPADSSQTVEVQVEASDQSNVGSYSVPLSINSQEDNTVKEVGITANVVKVKTASSTGKPLLTLAVVLGIVFAVLLIVLFVTVKKPKEMGEEETAYY